MIELSEQAAGIRHRAFGGESLLGLAIPLYADGAAALAFRSGVPAIPHEVLLRTLAEWWGQPAALHAYVLLKLLAKAGAPAAAGAPGATRKTRGQRKRASGRR